MRLPASWLRLEGWAFGVLFALVVIIGHIPGVNDAEGRLFGLFHITLYQDLLHGFSGLWSAAAAWRSPRAVRIYFQWFGTTYFLDGVLGAITGVTFLDFGVFLDKAPIEGTFTRILANLPHIGIGGAMMFMAWYHRQEVTPRNGPS